MNIYKPPKQKSYSFSKKNPIPIISYKINFKSSSKSKINKINGQNDYNINKTPYKRKIIHSSNNSRDFSNTINTTINSNNRYSDFNNNNNLTININNNNETHRSFVTNISEFNFEDEENEKNNNLNNNNNNNNNNYNKANRLKRSKVKKISYINIDNYLKEIDNNNINNNNNMIDINNFNSNNNDKYICENNICEKCIIF